MPDAVTVTLTEEERDRAESALAYFAENSQGAHRAIFLGALAKLRGVSAPADPPACERCAFWSVADSEHGWCRRYAPRPAVLPDTGEAASGYAVYGPHTRAGHWCGEFLAKGAAHHLG